MWLVGCRVWTGVSIPNENSMLLNKFIRGEDQNEEIRNIMHHYAVNC